MGCEFHRLEISNNLNKLPVLDTCTEHTAQLCQIPGGRGGKFKLPTLTELHNHLFGVNFGDAHNATADVEATTRCFLELIRLREFSKEKLGEFYKFCKNLNLDIIGTMCIPPVDQSPKKYFTEMNKINQELNFKELSMGMSSDYLEAIQNNATFIRVGSKIFGSRG